MVVGGEVGGGADYLFRAYNNFQSFIASLSSSFIEHKWNWDKSQIYIRFLNLEY